VKKLGKKSYGRGVGGRKRIEFINEGDKKRLNYGGGEIATKESKELLTPEHKSYQRTIKKKASVMPMSPKAYPSPNKRSSIVPEKRARATDKRTSGQLEKITISVKQARNSQQT